MRRWIEFAIALPAAGLLLGAPVAAAADDTAPDVEDELGAFLAEHGVSETDQQQLLAAHAAGEPWDSVSGGEPVTTDEHVEDGEVTRITRFEDGSIEVSTAPDPDAVEAAARSGDVTTQSDGVSGCVYQDGGSFGGSWSGCRAEVAYGVANLAFEFDYSNYQGQGRSLDGFRNAEHSIVGGTWENSSFSRQSDTAVRYSGTIVATQNAGSATFWLQVDVGGSAPTTSNNEPVLDFLD